MPTPTPESHSVQGRFSSNNPHHLSQEASQSSSIVGDNHRGHPSPSDTANNHAFPNPDSATSSDAQGIPASENVGGATSQYGSFHPDHDKVDLSQHEAWQNQDHHEFPTPQATSGASSMVSSPLSSDGSGITSSQSSPIVADHSHDIPQSSAGNGAPVQDYYGSSDTDSSGTGSSVQSGTLAGGESENSSSGEGTTSQAAPIVGNHHTNTDSAAPPASSGAVYNGGGSIDSSQTTTEGNAPAQSSGGVSPVAHDGESESFSGAGSSSSFDEEDGALTTSYVENGDSGSPVETTGAQGGQVDPGKAPGLVDNTSGQQPTAETSDVHAIEEDVQYDFQAASKLKSALETAAENLNISYGKSTTEDSGTRGKDKIWNNFSGKYADDAKTNRNQLNTNAINVSKMLFNAAGLVQYLSDSATVEQSRRLTAREDAKKWWIEKKIEDGAEWIQDKWDSYWGNKNTSPQEIKPKKPSSDLGTVAAPAPISESGSSGTSSAVPNDIDAYVSLCDNDTSHHEEEYKTITGAWTEFEAGCKYGTLDIRPALIGLQALNTQSGQLTSWLTKVAQAFRDADGSAGDIVVRASDAFLDLTLQSRGVGTPQLQHIDATASEIAGEVPSSGYANDPVNVATGNFIEPETDLVFTGTVSESTLSLTRMYNSLAITHADEMPSGVFGLGWFSTLDTHLSFGDEQASWFMPDGREVLFDREGEGFARAAREPWWLTKVPATDELFTRVRDAQVQAYEQATVTGGSAVVPEVPFVWMVQNNQHEAYFYAPSGAPVARRQGHLSSLTVFVLAEDGAVTDLVHPVAHRGVHVDYEPAEETGGARPAAAFMYNTIGERAGEPVQNVAYSYTEAAESSASVQVSGLLTGVATGIGTRTYTHTERGLIHRVINARGDLEVTNTYDDSGRVIGQISEYGRDISYRYTPNVTTIIADADTGENSNLWVSDAKGRLLSITATDGTRMSMSYDRFSNRVSITERDGSRLVRTSDARGHIKRERTPEGADYTYTWDEQDRLLSVSVRDARDVKNLSDPMPVNSYHYEESTLVVNPNPVAVLDGAGEATTWEYSPEGDILKITDPTGVFTAFEYDEHHDIVAMLNPAGEAIRFTRDAAGQVTSVSNPLGATTTIEYNAAGVLTSFTNPLGARWTLTYPKQPVGDGAPYMVRAHQQGGQACDTSVGALPEAVTDPAGNTTAFTYTAGGDIATVTNAVGGTTRHEYDTFGNLVKMITAGNRVWEYSWDGLSQLVGLTDPTGAITRFEYDRAGEITQVTDATGVISHRSIERHEGVESVTGTGEGLFSSAFFKVDVLGRVTEISQQDGASTKPASSSHDTSKASTGAGAAGAGIAGTAGTGIPHGVSSSAEAIAAAETAGAPSQPTGRQMFTYDTAGNIVEALDANGGLTQYVRDAAGRVTRIISAAGRFTDYTYDTCGRLVTESVGLNEPVRVTDPVTGALSWEEPTRWAVTTLVYNAASQVIERHTPDGLVEKMTYDAAGRLIKVQAGRRVATYAWDACNQLVRVQDSTFGTRRYAYNELGQLVRVTDGLGNRTFFAYDADGLLTSVTDPTGAITEYEYDAAGRILEVAKKPHPDSTVETSAIRTTYTWDAAGRLLSEDDGVRTRSFEYDARTGDLTRTLIDGSLAAEYGTGTPALPGSTITWMKDHTGDAPVTYRRVFDATGNLVEYTRQVDGTENTSEPGTAEALETFTSTGSYTLTYAYDADGFRTMMLTPYGASQWVLDGSGRPIRSINTASVADPGVRERESVIGEFSYDVMGHLVRAQVGETISTWEFDQDGLVSSYERTSEQGDENTAEGVQVIRDRTGRIIGLDSTTSGLVMYSYDEAGQLTGARADGYELTWVYESGLMVAERLYHHNTAEDETTQGRVLLGERQFIYNGLNQLLHCTTIERPYTVGEGVSAAWVSTEVSYTYNAAGQRTGQKSITSDGVIQERTYTWGITGALATVSDTTTDAHGAEVPGLCSRLRVHADATGVATAITGNDQVTVPLLWDPTSSAPHLLGAGSIPVAGADGGFSQAAVPGGFDPWSVPGVPNTGVGFGALSAPGLGTISATGAAASQSPGLPSALGAPGVSGASALLTSVGLPEGVSFTGSGTLAVGGLALMGARVFDPSSKKFLSQDPLPPIVGAGWFADSYSFLGHDPVGMIDPWGTRPMSQEEYSDYSKKQDLQVLKTAISWVGTAIAIASVFVPGGPLVALGVAALGSAVSGFAEGMLDENGNFDRGSAMSGAGWGALIGLAGGAAGKVFSSGKMFLKPMQKVAEKFGSRGQALATKLENRFALDKVDLKDPSTLGFSKFGAGKEGFKKYTGEILDGGLSSGVTDSMKYLKDAKNRTPQGFIMSFGAGAVTGFGTTALTSKVKSSITDKSYFKSAFLESGTRYATGVDHVGRKNVYTSRAIQKTMINEAGNRAANTLLKPADKIAQNELIHQGEEGYNQDYGKTWSEEAQSNARGSLKDLASAGKKTYTTSKENLKGGGIDDQVLNLRDRD
ncbi:DUF6531 domain-containing protein [Rothia dentocariosa]|uniref:DUF6531 domain-containing protein n=1 Tax=Rothia dentocariosa TaxID=2047 RepID=UPI001A631F8C|nr:DUF6531 domain-containing protein [Rothia dentocariosa]VTY12504.1 putative deoxyribonuclease RhsB [Rothia dentocariosa]